MTTLAALISSVEQNAPDILNAVFELGSHTEAEAITVLKKASANENLKIRYLARKSLKEARQRQLREIATLPETQQADIIKNIGADRLRYAVDPLVEYFQSAPFKVQIAICQALAKINDKRALAPILEFFKSPDLHPFVVSTLVKTIGSLGSFSEVPILLEKLKSDDDRMRANTIEALEFIGDKRIVEIIKPLLEDKSSRVQTYAAKALLSFDVDISAKNFDPFLESDDETVRENAIYALSQSRHHTATAILKKQLYIPRNLLFAYDGISRIILDDFNASLADYLIQFSERTSNPEIKIKTRDLVSKLKIRLTGAELAKNLQLKYVKEFLDLFVNHSFLSEAVDLAEFLCEITPGNTQNLYQLAALHKKNRQHEKCLETLLKLLQLDTKNIENIVAQIAELQKLIPAHQRILESISELYGIIGRGTSLKQLYENAFTAKKEEYKKIESYETIFCAKYISDYMLKNNIRGPMLEKAAAAFQNLLQYYYSCFRDKQITQDEIFDLFYCLLADKRKNLLPASSEIAFLKHCLLNTALNFPDLYEKSKEFIKLFSKIEKCTAIREVYPGERYLCAYFLITGELKNDNSIELSENYCSLAIHTILAEIYSELLNDYPNAIYSYELMLENAPENIEYHLKLAELYQKNNNIEEAIFEYMYAAGFYQQKNDYKKAGTLYEKIFRLDPENISALSAAISLYQTILKEKPTLENIKNAALLHARSGDIQAAINVIGAHQSSGNKKDLLSIIDSVIVFCKNQHKLKEEIALMKLKLLFSDDSSLIHDIAALEFKFDHEADTKYENPTGNDLKIYFQIVMLKKDYSQLLEKISACSDKSLYDYLLTLILSAENNLSDSQKLPAYTIGIKLSKALAKFDVLEDFYKKYISLKPSEKIYQELATLYYSQNNHEKAQQIYETLHKNTPDKEQYIIKLAELAEKNNPEKSAEYYKTLISQKPLKIYLEKLFMLAENMLFDGNSKKAIKLFSFIQNQKNSEMQELVDEIMTNEIAILSSIRECSHYIAQKSYENILAFITRWSSNPYLSFLSIHYIRELIRLGYHDKGSLYYLYGEIEFLKTHYTEAIEYYKRSLGFSQNYLKECKCAIAQSYMKLSNPDEAVKTLSTLPADIISSEASVQELIFTASEIFMQNKEFNKAKTACMFLHKYAPAWPGLDKMLQEIPGE